MYDNKYLNLNNLVMMNNCISKKFDSIFEPTLALTTVHKQIFHRKIPYVSIF